MSNNKSTKKTNNGFYKPEFEPFEFGYKKKPYVDPLKNKDYKDPLRERRELIPKKLSYPLVPEYKPYTSFHEYKMPDIDPLTGKPRRKRGNQQKKETEPKVKRTKEQTPEPKPQGTKLFPKECGSSIGSVQRTIRIQDNLSF